MVSETIDHWSLCPVVGQLTTIVCDQSDMPHLSDMALSMSVVRRFQMSRSVDSPQFRWHVRMYSASTQLRIAKTIGR